MKHEQEKKHIIKALIPTKVELLGLTLASALFLSLNAAQDYFQALDSVNYEIVARNIEEAVRGMLGYVDKYLGLGLPTLLFWMLIGTLAYSIIWIAGSTISAYKDDLPTTKGIVFPRGYKKSNLVHEAIAKIAMRTASAIALIVWIYLFFTDIVPMTISTFMRSTDEQLVDMAIESVASVVILSGSIFIIFVLMRFTILRSRVFYR